MFVLDDVVVCSATDLTLAMECEFAVLRRLDEIRGLAEPLEVEDLVRDRAAALGFAHEERVLASYRERFGEAVVEVERVAEWSTAGLQDAQRRTVAALRAGAPVVAQGAFFDGRVHGRPDFLLRADLAPGAAGSAADGPGGGTSDVPRYAVADAKLARWARPTAVLQTGVYADQLVRAGVGTTAHTHLLLGSGEVTSHDAAAAVAVVGELREHVLHLLDAHAGTGDPVRWGADGVLACGRCDRCRAQLEPARDVRLVWGMRNPQREALAASGVSTIDELATSTGPVPRVEPNQLARLRRQAQLQLQQEEAELLGQEPAVVAEVHTVEALDALPPPDAGDIFFDFEGDPFWTDGDHTERGLEYLFGFLENRADDEPGYRTFWAHDRAQEKQALLDFLAYLRDRRAQHPGMHVYHYAFYEPAALRRLAERHGVGTDEVDDLLAAGVLVDLYEAVKRGVHVSQRSYSIKKLEPLYMGTRSRPTEGVTTGSDSVLAYADARALRDGGDDAGWQERLDDLAAYNRYDCLSTLRLRDWLLARRDETHLAQLDAAVAGAAAALGGSTTLPHGSAPHTEQVATVAAPPPTSTALRPEEVLARRLLADPALAQDRAAPLLAAALSYHRREEEPFWLAHRERLSVVGHRWHDDRDVLQVHRAEAGAFQDPGSGRWRRRLVVEGRLGTGSTLEPGAEVFCVYHPPLPFGMEPRPGQTRAAGYADVVAVGRTEGGEDRLELRERLPAAVGPHHMVPVLVTPGPPPSSRSVVAAIADVARGLLGDEEVGEDATAGRPAEHVTGAAALDLLRRDPPRRVDGTPLPPLDAADPAGPVDAVTAAVLASADSYVAVQGPPGSGKTRLGAEVLARLVTGHGWRVGVVAQSHAVVENLLEQVVAAGVDPELVGKRGRRSGGPATWRHLDGTAVAEFLTGATSGCVLGGTQWDFTNRNRVAPGGLDLLVVEEAGQFSLAATVAVGAATRRLLLLGDPQQLPQVSQGVHELPVDASALAWLAGGADTLPPPLGYLLGTTWRMHPELCAAVSRLSYDGRLRSAPSAARRHLSGIEPGVHVVGVEHVGNAVDSPEESAEAVAQIERLLGEDWDDGTGPRPLGQGDVLVVAAYNAQVRRIRRDLDQAGLVDVRVGTVDRFQGQEAVLVVVSLAASSAADAPRGLGFLLSRNRITVALSRARWAAIVLRSPALTRAIPRDEDGLVAVGAFIALSAGAHERRRRRRSEPVASGARTAP